MKVNHYTHFKFSLPLFTFFGMVLGLAFIVNLSSNLIYLQTNAHTENFYIWNCVINDYTSTDGSCSGGLLGTPIRGVVYKKSLVTQKMMVVKIPKVVATENILIAPFKDAWEFWRV